MEHDKLLQFDRMYTLVTQVQQVNTPHSVINTASGADGEMIFGSPSISSKLIEV
jgi:hypothetical protein